MHPKRRERLIIVVMILFAASAAAGLALYALRQNINFFYSPTQVVTGQAPQGRIFRLGGIVKAGSIHHSNGLAVEFILVDREHAVRVDYNGILPDLFRDNQGIVTQGQLSAQGVFIADQVLAKHGSDYIPKEVSDMLTQQAKKA